MNVPVTIHGAPAEGHRYIKTAMLPISKLGIASPEIALEPRLGERLEKVKQMVFRQLPTDGPIYDLGYESYTLNKDSDWHIV